MGGILTVDFYTAAFVESIIWLVLMGKKKKKNSFLFFFLLLLANIYLFCIVTWKIIGLEKFGLLFVSLLQVEQFSCLKWGKKSLSVSEYKDKSLFY